MGDVINLRRARKVMSRRGKEAEAAASRVAHGTPKHLREEARAKQSLEERRLDERRLDEPPRDPVDLS